MYTLKESLGTPRRSDVSGLDSLNRGRGREVEWGFGVVIAMVLEGVIRQLISEVQSFREVGRRFGDV